MSITRTDLPETIYQLYDWRGDLLELAATRGPEHEQYFYNQIAQIDQQIAAAESAWQLQQEQEQPQPAELIGWPIVKQESEVTA